MSSTAPWHHWPVALLALLFNLAMAADYTLTKYGFEFWYDQFPEAVVTLFTSLTGWVDAVWAIAAWGGLIGAWLLLRRNKHSVLLLFLAMVAHAVLAVWLCLFARPTIFGAAGFQGFYLLAGTVALALVFYLYARWERSEMKME